jgi:hypothetical protein
MTPARTRPIRTARFLVVTTALGAASLVVAPASPGAAAAPATSAATSAAARFAPVAPCRLLDTRAVGPAIAAGAEVTAEVAGRCGVPADATAVAITVTAVDGEADGFVTVWPAGAQRPNTSSVNHRADQVVANAQLVQLGDGGDVRLFTHAAAHLLLDVTGYFVPANGPVRGGRYVPVDARRLVDTRSSARPSIGGAVTVRPDVPGDAIAVAVNIATFDSSAPGFFTAYPAGLDRPTASVLNTDDAGQTRAAAAIVPLSQGGFEVYTQRGDHVIVDITGYFTGESAPATTDGLFVAVTPTRLIDTRRAAGPSGGPRLWDRGARDVVVTGVTGGPVAAIAANVTMTHTEDPGFVVAGPARVARSTTSAVNADRAQATVANAAIVGVSTAGVGFEAYEATHLVVDVTGWFTGAPVAATEPAPRNAPPADRRVVVISDSAMAGVRWNGALGGFQGFVADARLESCRRLVQGSCRGREGYIPLTARNEILSLPAAGPEDIVVISVGYNDWHDRFSSDFDAVVAAARSRGFHHVAWVTYRSGVGYTLPGTDGTRSNYGAMNDILRRKIASGEYPEVRLWDLDAYTTPTPTGWFASDGVHETVLGSWGVADWVSRQVRAFDDRPCVQPWVAGGPVADPCPDPDLLPGTVGHPDVATIHGV